MWSPSDASDGHGLKSGNDDQEIAAEEAGRVRPRKSAEAFRTISEVADELNVPQHVLRFWETKFPRIKPLKRGGGRRYYRPEDVSLLRHIANLLYIQGYTIKGVQRLLKESGGVLLENIPPASAEERAEAATEQNTGTSADRSDSNAIEAGKVDPPLPPPLPSAIATRQSDSSEAHRLRMALSQVLQSLEALRASFN